MPAVRDGGAETRLAPPPRLAGSAPSRARPRDGRRGKPRRIPARPVARTALARPSRTVRSSPREPPRRRVRRRARAQAADPAAGPAVADRRERGEAPDGGARVHASATTASRRPSAARPLARDAVQGEGIQADGTVHGDVQSTIDSTRGSGSSLDPGVADRLGESLGDLSDVRVHTDDTADRLNTAVSARAFATGTDVYFASGEYSPGSRRRRQADRARARPRRPAARRGRERPAHRVAARRRDGARGRQRGRPDRMTQPGAASGRLRLHRPPRDGRGGAGRVERPEPGRPVPRPLHLRRPRAGAHQGRQRLRRRRAPQPGRAPRSGSTCSTPPCSRSAPRRSSTRATGASTPTCRTTSRASSRARASSATC